MCMYVKVCTVLQINIVGFLDYFHDAVKMVSPINCSIAAFEIIIWWNVPDASLYASMSNFLLLGSNTGSLRYVHNMCCGHGGL